MFRNNRASKVLLALIAALLLGMAFASTTPQIKAAPVAFPLAVPSDCTNPVTPVAPFNLYVGGFSAQYSGSAAGRVAVGGQASFANYNIGAASTPSTTQSSLVVGGGLTYYTGKVSGGNANYGTTSYATGLTIPSGKLIRSVTSPYFVTTTSYLKAQSAVVAALPANGATTLTGQVLYLHGVMPDEDVFTVSSYQLYIATVISITVPVSTTTVVVNVSGFNPLFQYLTMSSDNALSKNILWNFYQAQSMTIRQVRIKGSVLAPSAKLFFGGNYAGFASVDGQLAAGRLLPISNQWPGGTLTYTQFSGCVSGTAAAVATFTMTPTFTNTPTPTNTPTATNTPTNTPTRTPTP